SLSLHGALPICPDIGAVTGDKDRRVSDDLDAKLVRAGTHTIPLSEEQVLEKRVGLGLIGQLGGERGRPGVFKEANVLRPFPPRTAVEMILHGLEERERVKPAGLGGLEFFEIAKQGGAARGFERLECLEQRRPFRDVKPAVIDTITRQFAQRPEIVVRQQSGGNQRGQIDQVRIARERRKTLVGRIAVAGRPERTNLPEVSPRCREKLKKTIRRRIQNTDTLIARERGGVQQHAARTVLQPRKHRGRDQLAASRPDRPDTAPKGAPQGLIRHNVYCAFCLGCLAYGGFCCKASILGRLQKSPTMPAKKLVDCQQSRGVAPC